MFPRFFYATCHESDRMFISHRFERFSEAKRMDLAKEYERRYKAYGRDHTNAWLDEIANKQGSPVLPNVLLIQRRLEKLNQLSRERRNNR